MSAKFTFQLTSDDRRRPFPHKLLIAQSSDNESIRHVGLKLIAWMLFYRERLQVETAVPDDAIPFVPDLVELGYDLRPRLWIECGDCGVGKLHKVAVRCPEAEIWIMKRSAADAERLRAAMERDELRRGRYALIGLDPEMFREVCGLLRDRNTLHWFSGGIEAAAMQFELNGLWFDGSFTVLRY